MESLIRKGRDLVCGTHKNALSKIDESGPLFQPRPKASHDEGPSSDEASSSDEVEVKDGNLDDLWERISEHWKLREEENYKRARYLGACIWPNVRGLQDLKGIVLLRGDQQLDVEAILTSVNVAIVAPLVVALTFETYISITNREELRDLSITNREELRDLTKIMYDLALLLKRLSESPEGMQDVMQKATSLIVEGARVLSLQGGPRKGGPRRLRSDVSTIRQKLDAMYLPIITQFTARVFTPIPHPWRSHLSEKYRTHSEKVKHINLDELWEHIFKLWELREEGNHKKARSVRGFLWPDVQGWRDLKEIVLLGADPIKDIHEHVKIILRRVNVAIVAPLVVAHTLERLDASITNTEELWHLIEVMYDLAIVLEELSESSGRTQEVMQEATSLIVEGARVFSLQGGRRRSASEAGAGRMVQLLHDMYIRIKAEFTFPFLTPIQPRPGSYLSKNYLKHAVFKMEALVAATNSFDEDNKVGEGGFGAVYKGTTHDGKQIAVKKMSFTDERRREFMKKQFENEKLLAEFPHPNIVNLLGSCEQESQGFLVYEYLPNGSLDKFLFDPENRKRLDWPKRYNIMQGIARALQYLHEDSRVRIVHRDIKASNILLDEKLNPKIADFGTANLFPEDRTHVTATSAVGTFGYMAPECLMTGKLSVRTDVYSFGIVLLELLTGEKISSDALKLLGWVWRSYKRKEVVQTIDPTIIETWDKEKGKALRCIQVALLCIQENSSDRPTMSEVTAMLSTSESLPVPKKPPFQPSTRRSWF